MAQSREFARVRNGGRSVHGRLLRLSALPSDDPNDPSKFGLITSRRVGGAVDRNAVRRRMREICRLHRSEVLPGHLVVTIAKSLAVRAKFSEMREEWLRLARRLSILRGSE